MKIYYKQFWGVMFIVMGAALLFLNLMLLNLGSIRIMQLALSFFIAIIGILYLTRPYFELRTNEIVLFNLFGMELKTYRFDSLQQIQVLDGKIYINNENESRKVRLNRSMARTEDWEKFIRTIRDNDLTGELHNLN